METTNKHGSTEESGSGKIPLQRLVMPDICSSFSGCAPPRKHCRDCSHAYFNGHVILNEKKHFFEFSPQFGVTFMTAKGEERKKQPSENSPVWEEFGKWHDKIFGA